MPYGIAILLLQIVLAVHAGRTGRVYPWIWLIIVFPGIGCLLYVIIELAPEWMNSRTGRRARSDVVRAVNPGREYRALARQVEIAPTVHNKLLLAEECLRLNRPAEALSLYESSATGMHRDDPGILLGLARAQFALNDFVGTLGTLDSIPAGQTGSRSADGHLLYARALDGVGRSAEALTEYAALVQYASGEEARCRYAELLRRTGAEDAANAQYREIVRRVDLQGRHYRSAQREWYDTARQAVA